MISIKSARQVTLPSVLTLWLGCAGQSPKDDAAMSRDSAVTRDSAETVRVDDVRGSRLTGPVTLTRSGGLAGYDDQVVIHADGRVERLRGGAGVSARVSDEIMGRLTSALANAVTWANTDTADVGADRVLYSVEYGGRRLRVDAQTAGGPLAPLRDLIQLIFGG